MQSTNMSQNIRDFAEKYPVFGSDEIRKIYGDKAAALVTRLAAKGMFVRIKNGVFGKTNVDQNHPAYQDYLKRSYDALVIKAASPEATLMDKIYVWASERENFRPSEASAYFGQDVSGHIMSAFKRGKFMRPAEGVYHYPGYIPADRRTAIPMAEEDGPIHRQVLEILKGRLMSAAEIRHEIDVPATKMKAVLERLNHDGKIVRVDPSSINKHYSYHLPGYNGAEKNYEDLCVLAIIAVSGPVSTLGVKNHRILNAYDIMRELYSSGLIKESGIDENLGGKTYEATREGVELLKGNGFSLNGQAPEFFRPLEREIINVLRGGPMIGYEAITDKVFANQSFDASRKSVHNAIQRLIQAGALTSDGKKPSTVEVSDIGLSTFLAQR